jgi:hypothetical protein
MRGPLIYYDIKDMYGSDLSILDEIDLGFNVEVDFKDVRSLSKGWTRNAFGIIVKTKGVDFFKNHILLSNMSKDIRKSITEATGQVLV